MDLAPGTLIAGQYRVERKIAEGGMGEVWVGVHAQGARVAIKRLLPEAASDHHLVTRFKREAYLLGRIRSNHVTQVVEFITDDTFGMLLVMEYIEGENLADMLEKRRVLSVEETLDIGVDLARAIADLHRANLIHRDIKPENVIFRRLPSGERRAVIIDFGLSRLVDQPEERPAGEETLTGITRADSAIGTIAYMAPEQLISSRDVNHRADIYALGAILYRAAAGKNVFGSTDDDIAYARQKLHEEAPPLDLARFDRSARALERIVTRAIRRRPAERYETVEAMLADMVEARAGRAANPEVDAPTQTAPVSSLLGAPPEPAGPRKQLDSFESMETVRPPAVAPAPAPPAFAPPPLPGATDPRVVLSPAATMPMPPQAPIADPRPPPPAMRFAPPPMPPASIPGVNLPPPLRPPMSSITEVGLRGAATAPHPGASPSLDELRIPKTLAAVTLVATLVGGMVLGFLAHALLF
ncbi:serine/threonine-protein kinase [Polyangium aurulentum]|uniref:serine/threonine-protein kinase n=1 Tax=Polyangium aurulentum TaxID=2567896 RepID=UPI0010AECF62|nr:serine/threonine-protein kinase [Polyangium aurulentum]UQA59772.1 serine/threonine protein kinase [Polyangium aurulentum]